MSIRNSCIPRSCHAISNTEPMRKRTCLRPAASSSSRSAGSGLKSHQSGSGQGWPRRFVRRLRVLQRPRGELLVRAEAVLDPLAMAAPNVERRTVAVAQSPHPVRRRAVERAPPVRHRALGNERFGMRTEHVVRDDARVDLEAAQHRLARRLDELRWTDFAGVRLEVLDQLPPHLRRREEVDRHAVRLLVPQCRLHALARVHALSMRSASSGTPTRTYASATTEPSSRRAALVTRPTTLPSWTSSVS